LKVSRPGIYAHHILEAIENIRQDTAGHDFASFRQDRRSRQLVERNLEIISEASRRLPNTLKAPHPEIPWRDIAGIGNMLRHEYHKTFPTIIWETCRRDLDPLQEAVQAILSELSSTDT